MKFTSDKMKGVGFKKKGLSNLIAYVMLIAITLSLSVMVYGWLKFYVEGDGDKVEDCSDNVNIVINRYECFAGANGNLSIKLKNKGLFSVDGFILRVHNRSDAKFGFYVFENSYDKLKPGASFSRVYNFSDRDDNPYGLSDVKLVDIQPFMKGDDGKVLCKAYASQRVVCK